MESGGFTTNIDQLFSRNIPHISEKIFSNLDYDSLMASRRVNKVWKELLSSKRCLKMAREKLEEKKNNERRLCKSSRSGNVMEVRNLLSLGVNPNCEYDNRTPLVDAMVKRHSKVVKILLNAGANPDKYTDGFTPLYRATFIKKIVFVKMLLKAGAKVDLADERGITPLQRAAIIGCKEKVTMLIDAGAAINKATCSGITPLMQAAYVGCKDVVKVLLDRGADPNKADAWGRNPLTLATQQGHTEVLILLAKAMKKEFQPIPTQPVVKEEDSEQFEEDKRTIYKLVLHVQTEARLREPALTIRGMQDMGSPSYLLVFFKF